MAVFDTGVLITGPSGIGKSELALELVSRGHQLIVDDSPMLREGPPKNRHTATVMGYCPEALVGFLEVRGLGILNLERIYGASAIRSQQRIELIIDLQVKTALPAARPEERLGGRRATRSLLDVPLPSITLPVVAGRNLAVLVEAAAQEHRHREGGYSAKDDLIERHTRLLARQSEQPLSG